MHGSTLAGTLPVLADGIPAELRERDQWVLWRLEQRDGDKPTKLPYQTRRGRKAASDKPATWTSYLAAATAYTTGGYSGIGFVFAADDPYCGIDLDGCRDPGSGKIAAWAQTIIDQCDSYSEISPSGTGVKVFCRGKLPSSTGKKREVDGVPKLCDKTPAIELYDHKRYFAVTGHALPGSPAECRDCQPVIDELWQRYFAPAAQLKHKSNGQQHHQRNGIPPDALERCRKYVAKMPPAISGQGGHDATFAVACECFRFGLDDGGAIGVLWEYNARCVPPWSDAELWHKLADARERVTAAGEFGARLQERSGDCQAASGRTTPAPPLPPYRAFPVDALPGAIGEYVTAASRAIGCDPAYVALPLLASLASAVGNTRRISLKRTWQEPCILWTAIVGDSGTHKTPALSAATTILGRKQDEALAGYESRLADWQIAQVKYEADLADWRKAKGGTRGEPPERPDVPVCQRYVVSDTTVEALADRLQHAPRGLLLERDELAGWLGSFDQYKGGKGGDTAHWLTLYNAKPLRIDRKTGTSVTYVPIASVSIAGGIQPQTLRRALGREHYENGLAARLLLAMPPKKPRRWSEATVSESVERALAGVFARLLALDFGFDADHRPAPIDLPLTPRARDAWVAYYDRHGGEMLDMSGNEAALWSKLEGTAPRLALIMQLVSDPLSTAVDQQSMAAGIALADWFGHEGRRVYAVLGESDEDREQRQLVELIGQQGGTITARRLMHARREYRGSAELAEAALNELAAQQKGEWKIVSDGGRPARVFCLAHAGNSNTSGKFPGKTGLPLPLPRDEDVNRLLAEAAEVDADQF